MFQIFDDNPQLDDGIYITGSTVTKTYHGSDFGAWATHAIRFGLSGASMPSEAVKRMQKMETTKESALDLFVARTDYPGCWRMDMFNCVAKVEEVGQYVAVILSSR